MNNKRKIFYPVNPRKTSNSIENTSKIYTTQVCHKLKLTVHHKLKFTVHQITPDLHNYAGQEATVRTWHGTTDWFQIGQGCILSPCLFNLYAEYIMDTLCWKKQKLESGLPEEISITLDMQMTPPLCQKVKRNSKASWWKWKWREKKLA